MAKYTGKKKWVAKSNEREGKWRSGTCTEIPWHWMRSFYSVTATTILVESKPNSFLLVNSIAMIGDANRTFVTCAAG